MKVLLHTKYFDETSLKVDFRLNQSIILYLVLKKIYSFEYECNFKDDTNKS